MAIDAFEMNVSKIDVFTWPNFSANGSSMSTDRSPEVVWGLTKRFNCFKTKWNGKHWTYSPFSTNGFHNASQSANTIGVSVSKTASKNNFKRTFTMTLKHKAKNGICKRHANSQGNPATSIMNCGTGPNKAAKAIQAQRFISD